MNINIERLNVSMAKSGYSAATFQAKTGVSYASYVRARKTGKATPQMLGKLARALNVSIEYLVGQNEAAQPDVPAASQ